MFKRGGKCTHPKVIFRVNELAAYICITQLFWRNLANVKSSEHHDDVDHHNSDPTKIKRGGQLQQKVGNNTQRRRGWCLGYDRFVLYSVCRTFPTQYHVARSILHAPFYESGLVYHFGRCPPGPRERVGQGPVVGGRVGAVGLGEGRASPEVLDRVGE